MPPRPGPRADWFAAAALCALFSATYRVSPHSNRVGPRPEEPRWRGRGPVNCPPRAWCSGRCRSPCGRAPGRLPRTTIRRPAGIR
ncbi:hypothetical protein [Streptomyces sp. NPDC094021]|uniref:hypothetical protein n=1 Tax=Streptomyces sp. NPDC094021 TaxID=3366054 RepID=UPI0037F266E8